MHIHATYISYNNQLMTRGHHLVGTRAAGCGIGEVSSPNWHGKKNNTQLMFGMILQGNNYATRTQTSG
jgi:hypothetical protein